MSQLDLNNPKGMQELADIAHIGIAVTGLFPFAYMGVPLWVLGVVTAAGVIAAAYKEFRWDIENETPETSGGYPGGFEDFMGYIAGMCWIWTWVGMKVL